MLVDVYEQSKPTLTVVDGIMSMEGDGPATSGRLRETQVILASSDCVALDTIMAFIMGIHPLSIVTTQEAARRNLGVADLKSMQILGERVEDVIGGPFLLPATSLTHRLPRPVVNLAKKVIRYYPYVLHANCTRCLACIQACPNKAISLKDNKIEFDYARCIACFCCQEACPASAIKVKKSLLAKLIGL